MTSRFFEFAAIVGIVLSFAAGVPARAATPFKIAIAGDSTVCDYPANLPDRGWGMFLKEAFTPGSVEVRNFAKPGRSTKTFIMENLWQKTLDWKPDYVFIQFGHNDSHAPGNPEATDAAADYRQYLRRYIADSRRIGAKPILVTPMVRRIFHEDGTLDDNLKPYAEAMKEVARERMVPVIDLHAASWKLIEKMGPVEARTLSRNRTDPTHFNEKGARAMLGLVLQELREAAPGLGKLLAATPLNTEIHP